MIEVLPETKGNLIALKASGMVTEADLDACYARIEPIMLQEKVRVMFLDWQDLAGWAPGARSVSTWFGIHHRATVHRIAIVAAESWEDEKARMADVFNSAHVRRFPPAARADALNWLRQD